MLIDHIFSKGRRIYYLSILCKPVRTGHISFYASGSHMCNTLETEDFRRKKSSCVHNSLTNISNEKTFLQDLIILLEYTHQYI